MKTLISIALTLAIAVPSVAMAQATSTTQTAAWTISLPPGLEKQLVDDLNAAAADATANKDVRHGPCWTALADFAANGFNNPLPNKLGIFLLIQKGFDFQGQSGTPLIPTALAQACGPTILDLKVTFAQFLAKAGFLVSPIKIPLF